MGPWTFENLLSFLLLSARWGICFRLHTLLCLLHLSFNTTLSNGRYKKTSLHWTPALWNREYTSKRCELFPSQCHLTASWFLISPVVHIHFTSQESTASALFSLTILFSLGKQSLEEWMPTALSNAMPVIYERASFIKTWWYEGDRKASNSFSCLVNLFICICL